MEYKYYTRFQKNKTINKTTINKKINIKKWYNKLNEYDKNEKKDIDEFGNLKNLIDYNCKSNLDYESLKNIIKNIKKNKIQEDIIKQEKDSDDESYHPDDSENYNLEDEDVFYTEEDTFLKNLSKEKREIVDKNIKLIKKFRGTNIPLKIKILLSSSLNIKNKSYILTKLEQFYNLDDSNNEYHKLSNWIDSFKEIEFDNFTKPLVNKNSKSIEIGNYLNDCYNNLNKAIYGHKEAKLKIIQILGKKISNPNSFGNIIGLCGPPGIGKTQLAKNGISKSLNRPFSFVSLGGAQDSSFLLGFDYTYEGARNGKIIDIIKESKCMDPIIFFDELDKISDSARGEEIANVLIHLTDKTQNCCFQDKYLSGIDFDLSKCIFIFSFNDENKINKILKDRITILHLKDFNTKDKIKIAQNYLIPEILTEFKIAKNELIFNDDVLDYIITNFSNETGVRNLKKCLEEIVSKLNMFILLKDYDDNNITNKILQNKISIPYKITKKIIPKLLINFKSPYLNYKNMYI